MVLTFNINLLSQVNYRRATWAAFLWVQEKVEEGEASLEDEESLEAAAASIG